MMTCHPKQTTKQSATVRASIQASAAALLSVLCLVVFTPTALATAQPSESGSDESRWVVVTTETEAVRSGDQEIYYTITEAQRGAIYAAGSTSGDYTKVQYPAELGAVVPANQVRVIKAGTQVQLLEESKLKAESMLRGLAGSWNSVYIEPLPAETVLSVLDVIYEETSDGSQGEVLGYRVAPPRPPVVKSHPYAYIRTNSLRSATPEEIARHQGGKQITTGRHQLMPAPGRTTSNPNADTSTTESTPAASVDPSTEIELEETPGSSTDITDSAEGGVGGEQVIDLRNEMVLPEPTAPVEIQNTPPVTKPSEVVSPEKSGSASIPNKKSSAHITAASLEALESSFTNARSMPRSQLDEALPELLAEFNRTREAIGDDESETRALDQRIEWLSIRLKTRDQRRAIAQALATADAQSVELNQKMQQWNNSRVYSLVGRLMLSGVYTGEHLPLLYRVRAPDPVTGFDRTIGYVAPKDGQDLRPYLGRVVGIIGDPVRDQSLALPVLSPSKIEQMPGQ